MTPFKMIDYEEMEAILYSADCKALKDLKSVDAHYHVYSFGQVFIDKEFLIFQYYEPRDEDEEEDLLPEHIWSRIIIGPSFGEGTQVLQHGMLTLPLIVINEHNSRSIVEVVNDGIVAFEVNGNRELAKEVYLWMKENTVEYVFKRLGENIIDGYAKGLLGGDAKEFLINTNRK